MVDSSSHSCHPSLFYEGVIGADLSLLLGENIPLTSRLAIICGTSSCHMAVSTAVICYQKVTFLINLLPRFLLFFSPWSDIEGDKKRRDSDNEVNPLSAKNGHCQFSLNDINI